MDAINAWEKEEHIAHYVLSQKLPDLAIMWIHKLKTVVDKWDAMSAEYTKKGLFALCNTFMASCCPQGADVFWFLIDLGTRWEELISNRVTIDDADYHITILNSIPGWLHHFISGVHIISGVHTSITTRELSDYMEPNILSCMVSKEYKRSINESHANQDRCTHQHNDKKDDGNGALTTSQVGNTMSRSVGQPGAKVVGQQPQKAWPGSISYLAAGSMAGHWWVLIHGGSTQQWPMKILQTFMLFFTL
jgi:gag-polypeptide of LTR copia-type